MSALQLNSRRVLGAIIAAALAAGMLAVLLGAAPASAEAPSAWWGLTFSSRPTNLQAGSGKNEVQELQKGSVLTLVELEGGIVACMGNAACPLIAGGLPDDETAAQLQSSLEAAAAYGPGNVEVSESSAGGGRFLITSIGGDAARSVPSLSVQGAGASIKIVTPGSADGEIVVSAENLGDGEADGSRHPIQISDTLPSGLKAVAVEAYAGVGGLNASSINLAGVRQLDCSPEPASESPVVCTLIAPLQPYEVIEMRISVVVEAGASSGEVDDASVSGGGAAAPKAISRPIQIGGQPRFGVQESELIPEEVGGGMDTQAGSHPFQLTSVVSFNLKGAPTEPEPVALPKDVGVLAPPGLVGNPTPFTQCTDQQFAPVDGNKNNCPASSAIGVATITFYEPKQLRLFTSVTPIFNLVPNAGEPARFGFYAFIVPVTLNTSVRTGGDYGVTVSSHNTIQVAGLLSATITLWGVPGDPRHDGQRGFACLAHESSCAAEGEEAAKTPPPFLSLPTSCTGPLQSTAEVDSWTAPLEGLPFSLTEPMAAQDGCNHLPFGPEVSVAPDVSDGSTPSGLTVGVHVPQTAALNPEGLAESTLKDTTVVLPEGVTLNPGGADGLEACSEAQIGFRGQEEGGGAMLFTPSRPACPAASKIATVKIATPLLPNPLTGAVYLASPAPNGEPGLNPFDSLIAMYLVAEDPVSGVLVKLPGKVVPDPVTGQLTSTFEDTPQLPFEDLELHFFGGARAPLATPGLCGTYTTQASFTPWSGSQAVDSASSFQVTSGPNGSACQDPQPFAPEFAAGMTNIQAGGFSELRTTMGHPDADQALGGLSIKLPEGLMGSLAKVKLCEEPRAAVGTCGPESLIGHTVVTAGLGSEPVVVKRPGNVYITGPYKGAPYGLSIVNPAEAGPFNLGDVIVRAKIEVDPHTAQLTITSDPLPTILKGIPLLIQHVAVTIERPEFTFNPTNCSAMKIEGSMSSSQGASVPIATPFQVTNCAALPFKPGFTAKTKKHHTRKGGAYLQVHVASSKGQADIAKAHVELPKALPSRLSTLQKACTEAQFDQNPAGCPKESVVGSVVVHTPVLPVPLTGPAYFVSRGAQWPELIMVLQGYGVTVDLNGETHISKQGVTSTTLSTVPDVPFTSFTLTLPENPHSALAGNGNLCKKKLVMPVKLTGQNGATLEKNTKVKVHGCATPRKKKHRHKGKKHKAGRHRQAQHGHA